MIDTTRFLDCLLSNEVNKVAGVPCSFLSNLINATISRNIYEPFTNEGDAAAYAAGHALAGKKCAVIMQNSGLSNALSPLTSLNELFGLHVLLIIGNRGADDEPQHRLMSGAVNPFLNALSIPVYDAADGENAILTAVSSLKSSSAAILVNNKNVFSPIETSHVLDSAAPLRYDILKAVSECAKDSIIVTTTGFTSREMYCINDRAANFYMVGSMGCLSSFAMGIAESIPHKKVIAIDGDSACLMRLGAMYTLTEHAPDNLCYMVLDNGGNESTGGQPNAKNQSRLFDIMSSLYATSLIKTPEDTLQFIENFYSKGKYTQAYTPIRMGSVENLPRPDRELIFNQSSRFISAIGKIK